MRVVRHSRIKERIRSFDDDSNNLNRSSTKAGLVGRTLKINMFIQNSAAFLLVALLQSVETEAFQTASRLGQSVRAGNVLHAVSKDVEAGSRRSFLLASTVVTGMIGFGGPAIAKYGETSNMELPNYIDYLIEKNASVDQARVLYKGADPAVLLKRILEADKRLEEIPPLAEQKKWSQIQGILTGPLGTLSQTLNQIATPDSSPKVRDASKKLKGDLIEIGQAASQKNGASCTAKTQQATKDLESFVKAAFE